MYKVQIWDSDCECWEDDPDIRPTSNRMDAEDEMRQAKKSCSYPLKMRIIKE